MAPELKKDDVYLISIFSVIFLLLFAFIPDVRVDQIPPGGWQTGEHLHVSPSFG